MKTYSELAHKITVESGIKIKTEYVNDFKYNDNWIYLPRIYSSNTRKAKVRILKTGIDKVKNCIKITFDQDKIDKTYLVHLIESKKHLIKYHLHGSCQSFLTVSNLEQLLTIYNNKNQVIESAKKQLCN